MKKILLITLVVPFLMIACKKKEDKTKSDMLKEGKWRISELNISNENGNQNLLDVSDACKKDNFYIFNTDNSITVDEGTTKCDPNDVQNGTDGKWVLENNDTKLTFSDSKIFPLISGISLNVLSISSSTIKFSKDTTFTDPSFGTLTGKFAGTFTNIK